MSGTYRVFGSEMSPYSVKVRSYLRFKGLPHDWISRSVRTEAEYKAVAKLPIIPTVVTPAGDAIQDSTPIIDRIEAEHPSPPVHPDDPALRFLGILLEEFGDEWGNKLMFHYRWATDLDQTAAAQSIARLNALGADDDTIANVTAMVKARMSSRGHFVGSSPETAPLIADYYRQLLALLQAHLVDRPYLFGTRATFGDFGLAPQLYEMSIDPTGGSILRAQAPAALDWCYRMREPASTGSLEAWPSLAPTLAPILAHVAQTFLPWSDANARALAAGQDSFTVTIQGRDYVQGPQKYHAKSLAVLRQRHAEVAGDATLRAILDGAGALPWLAAA
ncbi:glutathione S-transferase N-terminal domain-containing protein [Zavarzinia sp. CC-PAN008]|uniref:glutathione S-transferase family protein n=1 Tax=Zavarzinia sp. CC-PAN008 TaxID=3243332 RepID=UPI003F743AA8